MSQIELIFRGLDEAECTSFIREVHKRAHEAGRLRDNAWMADIAMIAFDGGALKWFDEQVPETQADWALSRRALIRKYSDNHSLDPVPPTASVPPAAIATAAASMSIPTVSPSPRLTLIGGNEQPRFLVRVVAPAYSGYISKVLPSTDVTLTSDPGAAQEWLEIDGRIHQHEHNYGARLHTSNTIEGSVHEFLIARPSRYEERYSPNDLCFRLGCARLNKYSGDVVYALDGKRFGGNDVRWGWNIDHDGRIYLNHGSNYKVAIEKIKDGSLALNVWTQRVWTEDDDAYVSHLYLVRAV